MSRTKCPTFVGCMSSSPTPLSARGDVFQLRSCVLMLRYTPVTTDVKAT